jgi:isoleucyl-tRNA synthetase
VAREGETLALDLQLTPDLVRAGLAREVVRLVQEARKASGYDVSDRVRLSWEASGELAEALRAHRDLLAEEVLAVQVEEGLAAVPLGDGTTRRQEDELGLTFHLRRA